MLILRRFSICLALLNRLDSSVRVRLGLSASRFALATDWAARSSIRSARFRRLSALRVISRPRKPALVSLVRALDPNDTLTAAPSRRPPPINEFPRASILSAWSLSDLALLAALLITGSFALPGLITARDVAASFVRLAARAVIAALPVLVAAAFCALRLSVPLRLVSPLPWPASFALLRLALLRAFRLPPVTFPPPPPGLDEKRPFASRT